MAWKHSTLILEVIVRILVVCVLFGFNIVFNNLLVISTQSLVATGSSMLTFIVLPHCGIKPQTLLLDTTPVTLY